MYEHTCEIQDGDGWNSPRYCDSPHRCQACDDLESFDQISAEVYDENGYFMPVVGVCR